VEKRITGAGSKSLKEYLKSIVQYRQLLWVLALRDIKVQYAQTLLGMFWSALQPLTALVIYSFFFVYIMKVKTGEIPYALFVLSGISAWNYFGYIVNTAGVSLMQSRELIKNLHFPKIIIPLSKAISGVTDFSVSLLLVIAAMLFTNHIPGIELLFLPLFMAGAVLCGLAVALLLSTLTIRYRDAHHIIPFFIGFGIWFTPVFYPTSLLPEGYRYLLYYNPMAGVIAGFRWSLFGGNPPSGYYFLPFIPVLLLLVYSVYRFKNSENKIVDWI
jgi:lipopolysaccharide transport system permease protein